MKTILIIMGRYLPGYKDGGPVRSIKNLVDRLGSEYDFHIITTDRDHGYSKPYENILVNEWNQVGQAKVYYVSPGGFSSSLLLQYANESDLVYLCGCFNDYARTLLWLNRKGKIKSRIIIASMGLFAESAFAIKGTKKILYLTLLKSAGFFSGVEWSVTSSQEEADVKNKIGSKAVCHIAGDLPRSLSEEKVFPHMKTEKLKVIFLSRISPEKNLLYAIEVLGKVRGDLQFDIYGNKHNADYWQECKKALEQLPKNIQWNYLGEVDSEKVVSTFLEYDVFFFPTGSENYGHVIFEAMSAGCIPVISDNTPWTQVLNNGLGVAIPLERKEEFVKVIEDYILLEPEKIEAQSQKVYEYAKAYAMRKDLADGYRRMFDSDGLDKGVLS